MYTDDKNLNLEKKRRNLMLSHKHLNKLLMFMTKHKNFMARLSKSFCATVFRNYQVCSKLNENDLTG